MDIGFTGTQRGMTPAQQEVVWNMMVAVSLIYGQKVEAHHGLCIGADAQFHGICRGWVIPIVGHPPINTSKVHSFPPSDFVYMWGPKEYLDRNTDIVDCCNWLIATPAEYVEQLRSGTWSTIRKAKKKGIRGTIVYPDGTTEEFNETI